MDHLPTLLHLLEQLGCNALMYSIYALPEDPGRREAIYAAARAKRTVLHFANEGLAIAEEGDRAQVEALLAFAKYGQARPSIPEA